MAGLILAVGLIGFAFDRMPRESKPFWLNRHAVLGLATLVFVIVRLAWRLRVPPPALTLPPLVRRLSEIAHAALYTLMGLVPAFGLATLLARGRGLDFGFLALASPWARNRELAGTMMSGHRLFTYVLFGIAALHIAAALYHHLIVGDHLITRMMPKRGFG